MKQNAKLLEKSKQIRKRSLAYSKKTRNIRPSASINSLGYKIGVVVDGFVLILGIVLLFISPLWGILLLLVGVVSIISSYFFGKR